MPMTPDDAEIRARTSLYDFVRWMYRAQHNKTIIPAPHHSLVCSALERVIRGKTKRLIINIPPRSGKTLLVSQLFPAFWMGLNPASNFILTSYSKTLASNNTYAVRYIMRHEAYQWLWRDTKPQIKDDSQARDIFRTNANGMVYGRNIYQHDNPKAVVAALMAIIHQGAGGEEAWDIYNRG